MAGLHKPLAVAAATEAATGVALIAVPALVTRLLFGAELAGVALAPARVAGLALFALGLACWPGPTSTCMARCGMTAYNLLAAGYLLYVGLRGEWVGPLLWPAVVGHAVLTLWLARTGRPSSHPVPNNSQRGGAATK